MHELAHIIGVCGDAPFHFDFLDIFVAYQGNLPYINLINFKYIKDYVAKRRSNSRVS